MKIKSLIITISFLLFSCNLKELSLDDAKYFLEENQLELDSTTIQFFNQNSVETIIRKSNSKVFNILTNSMQYYIICFNGENFNVTIDAVNPEDEMRFWNRDFRTIVEDNYNGKNFYNFCVNNDIEKKSILSILQFMGKLDLWLINKSSNNNYVKYNIEPLEGIIYKDKNQFMNLASNIQIEKITETWFYFKEPF